MAKKKNIKSSKKKSSSKLLYLILIIVVALVCWFHEAILGFGFGSDKQEKVVVDKIDAIEVDKVEPIKVNAIKAEVKQNVPEKKVEVSTKNTKKEVVNLSDIKNLERPASIKNRSERIMQRMNYITSYNKQWIRRQDVLPERFPMVHGKDTGRGHGTEGRKLRTGTSGC